MKRELFAPLLSGEVLCFFVVKSLEKIQDFRDLLIIFETFVSFF
jgi:hypothetical protein